MRLYATRIKLPSTPKRSLSSLFILFRESLNDTSNSVLSEIENCFSDSRCLSDFLDLFFFKPVHFSYSDFIFLRRRWWFCVGMLANVQIFSTSVAHLLRLSDIVHWHDNKWIGKELLCLKGVSLHLYFQLIHRSDNNHCSIWEFSALLDLLIGIDVIEVRTFIRSTKGNIFHFNKKQLEVIICDLFLYNRKRVEVIICVLLALKTIEIASIIRPKSIIMFHRIFMSILC